MFKGFNNRQQNGFVNLSFFGGRTAYGQGGCNFWLRADFGLSTQTNGANISSWADSVGGYIFEQATAANQPILRTSSASYNNLPVVEFSGATNPDALTSARRTIGIRTIAFIANYNSITVTNRLCSGAGYIALGGTSTGINGIAMLNAAIITSTGTTENTNVKICVISDNFIMVNGVIESTTSAIIDFGFITLGNQEGNIVIGSSLSGNIAEIIGYSTAITTDQALAISTQLNQKYVIY